MKITSDHFYIIGSTHSVCQDYAVSGSGYAVLADGCSSSPNSDVGARLLAHALVPYLVPPNSPVTSIGAFAMCRAREAAREIGLREEMPLDTTLLWLAISHFSNRVGADSFSIRTGIIGDGLRVMRKRDGKGFAWKSVSFPESAPAYLSYVIERDRMHRYLHLGFGKRILTDGDITILGEGQPPLHHIEQKELPFVDMEEMIADGIMEVDPQIYDVAIIASDGLFSFIDEGGRPVPIEMIIEQIMAFKDLDKGFIQRRMRRFLTRFCKEHGWVHTDDVSVAGLAFNKEA